MKALSIRQPWAWLIVNGSKTVENRSWSTNYRGPLLIHAGKTIDREALKWLIDNVEEPLTPDELREIETVGAVIGQVDLVDCTQCPCDETDREWHNPGWWAWVLRNPLVLLEPIPAKGRLGLFDMDIDIKP